MVGIIASDSNNFVEATERVLDRMRKTKTNAEFLDRFEGDVIMQIKKTYTEVSPELLYAEIRDFTLKQGATLGENKLETYTLPDESASFGTRATLTIQTKGRGRRKKSACGRISWGWRGARPS